MGESCTLPAITGSIFQAHQYLLFGRRDISSVLSMTKSDVRKGDQFGQYACFSSRAVPSGPLTCLLSVKSHESVDVIFDTP